MAKSENQKMKLITLQEILFEKTDEEHPMTTQEIIDELAKYEIKAERKSIYNDIETLIDMGLDIVKESGRTNSYYVASREFQLAELKILVDVVQSAKFITEKKSKELIDKLKHQTNQYAAKQLSRNVVIANRNKASNETILYNVDEIYYAMEKNEQISFQYMEWTIEKKLAARKAGERYQVSPWRLIWDDENYYLLAYDEQTERMKHYRVDKMQDITTMNCSRLGNREIEKFDMAQFSKATFGMFAGEMLPVTLCGDLGLIGVVLDRFGKDITLRKVSEEEFEARVMIQVSPMFFGWLCSFGGNLRIKTPEAVKNQYKEYLDKLIQKL